MSESALSREQRIRKAGIRFYQNTPEQDRERIIYNETVGPSNSRSFWFDLCKPGETGEWKEEIEGYIMEDKTPT